MLGRCIGVILLFYPWQMNDRWVGDLVGPKVGLAMAIEQCSCPSKR
jgi:hypothetical protein